MSNLVLKHFYAGNGKNEAGFFIDVLGRQSGLLAFLLSLMKIDPTVSLQVNERGVFYKAGSFFGQTTLYFPISQISATQSGWGKPKKLFFASVGIAVFGLIASIEAGFAAFVMAEIVAAILFILYVLKKSLFMGVASGGDSFYSLEFKRSIIENVAVDEAKVNEAVTILNALVRKVNEQ